MRTKHLVPKNLDIDFISYLPNDLCSLIVSFLPTKEAIRTSILSKRWRYVYASSPSLDFDFSLFRQTRGRKQAFVDFVDHTLHLFSSSELKKFRLSMKDYGGNEPLVKDWIEFAIAHDVQELDLGLPRGKLSKIPDGVFQCGSITDLKLRMCDYAFELPSPLGLKKLKSVEIKSVSFIKGEFFKELFENCLVLEELVIEECRIGVLEIDGKRLEKLSISSCDWISSSQMKIVAPRLRFFNYIGAIADKHCLENLSSLVEVALNLIVPCVTYDSDKKVMSLVTKLAEMIGNAKVLTLSPWCIEQFSRVQNLPKFLQAQGENVKELILNLETKGDCVQMVALLLASCVNTENLSVFILPSQSLRRRNSGDGGRRRQWEQKIKGTIKCLKSVKLEYIDENKTGLELIKFLLKNANALEKMTIVPSKDGLENAKFMRKVSMFRKASKNAIVEYCMST